MNAADKNWLKTGYSELFRKWENKVSNARYC